MNFRAAGREMWRDAPEPALRGWSPGPPLVVPQACLHVNQERRVAYPTGRTIGRQTRSLKLAP